MVKTVSAFKNYIGGSNEGLDGQQELAASKEEAAAAFEKAQQAASRTKPNEIDEYLRKSLGEFEQMKKEFETHLELMQAQAQNNQKLSLKFQAFSDLNRLFTNQRDQKMQNRAGSRGNQRQARP